jgi:hypothetical protein
VSSPSPCSSPARTRRRQSRNSWDLLHAARTLALYKLAPSYRLPFSPKSQHRTP